MSVGITRRSSSPIPSIEFLESRQLLTTATTTTVSPSAKSIEMGTAYSLLVTVKAAKGKTVPGGTVELLSGGKSSGYGGALNSKGQFTFSYTAGSALFTGKYSFAARYLGSAKFGASKSKAAALSIVLPPFKAASGGVETAVVKTGKGTATVKAGDVISYAGTEYTTAGAFIAQTGRTGNGFANLTLDSNFQQQSAGIYDALIGTKVGETIDVEIPASVAGHGASSYYFIAQIKSIA